MFLSTGKNSANFYHFTVSLSTSGISFKRKKIGKKEKHTQSKQSQVPKDFHCFLKDLCDF